MIDTQIYPTPGILKGSLLSKAMRYFWKMGIRNSAKGIIIWDPTQIPPIIGAHFPNFLRKLLLLCSSFNVFMSRS